MNLVPGVSLDRTARRRQRPPPESTGPAASTASRHPLPSLAAVMSAPEKRNMPHLHPERVNGALWFKIDDCIRKDTVKTYQSNFWGPWWNYKMVPQEKKDAWWTSFVQKYYWDTQHHDMVYSRWEKILQDSIGDIVSKRKRKNKKPDFIGETDWIKMLELWDDEAHAKKCKTNPENAASNPDGLGSHRHTSGATNHCKVAHNMALEAGGVVQPITKVVRQTHTQKDGSFIDARTEAYLTTAEALAAERSQQSTQTDGISEPSVEQLDAAYIEIATNSKGRVYGTGSIQDIAADPKKSAAASILQNAQADISNLEAQVNVRMTQLEEQVNLKMNKIEDKVDALLRMNGIDPVTKEPIRRESGASAPSPRSEASHQPNLPSPPSQCNISPINLAALTPQNLPQYFEE